MEHKWDDKNQLWQFCWDYSRLISEVMQNYLERIDDILHRLITADYSW